MRKLVKQKKEENGWEFLFLGANIDAVETAAQYGIERDRSASFISDTKGHAVNYASLSRAMHCIRRSETLDESWKEEIEADYKKRKN